MISPTSPPKPKGKPGPKVRSSKMAKANTKRAALEGEEEEEVAEEAGSEEKMRPKLKPKSGAKSSKSSKGLTTGDNDDESDDDGSAFAKPLAKKASGLKRTKTRPEVTESMYGPAALKRRRISETEEDVEGGAGCWRECDRSTGGAEEEKEEGEAGKEGEARAG